MNIKVQIFKNIVIVMLFTSCSEKNSILAVDPKDVDVVEIYDNDNLKDMILKIDRSSEIEQLFRLINKGKTEVIKFRPKYRMIIIDSTNTEIILFLSLIHI